MHDLLTELFPLNRSLTGDGVRETLRIIQREIPALNILEVPSGTKAFDWTVPDEWNCKEAYLVTPQGERICDFSKNNLHLVGYSVPIDEEISLDQLQSHLHSLPEQPEAIPYVTSYYHKNWGFCITQKQRDSLTEGKYRVLIKSRLESGSMTYGEVIIPSTTVEKKEIFISTNICHPSMANNELSGPVVTTFLTKWLLDMPVREFNYRIIFIPETIGSIFYLSKSLEHMKENVLAGFNLTCLGDDGHYSFVSSRAGNTLADSCIEHVLKHSSSEFKKYDFLRRGSDERQYCSPGVDLPLITLCRSKFHEYPEYHTSLDNLEFISEEGLAGSLTVLQKAVLALEMNRTLSSVHKCEPFLGKYDLYPKLSTKKTPSDVALIVDLLTYSDGKNTLLDIANIINRPIWELYETKENLRTNGLIKESKIQ